MLNDKSKTIQTLWVVTANLFSFSFAIISSAILSRILSIEQYGLYKQVIYIYTTLLVVFTLGIPRAYAYFLPKVDIAESKDLVKKITKILFMMGIIMGLCLYFGSSFIAQLLNSEGLTSLLRLFSIVPVLMLPTLGIENILVINKLSFLNTIFVVLSKLVLLMSVVLPVLLIEASCMAAVAGFVVSSVLIAILAFVLKGYPYRHTGNRKCSLIKLTHIFKFSLPLMIAGIFGILIQSADQFFVSRYFGVETFALYSNGALELPFVSMITGATATVLLPYFTKEYDKGNVEAITSVFKTTILKSALLIYPLLIFCWIFAPDIMQFLYGTQYSGSSDFFRITSIINFFNILTFAPLLIAMGKVKAYAIVQAVITFMIYITEILAVKYMGVSALGINTISLLFKIGLVVLMFAIIQRYIHFKLSNLFPLKQIGIVVLGSIVLCFLSLCLIDKIGLIQHFTRIIVAFIAFAILFSVSLLRPLHYLQYLPKFKK